jgi:hypothetical protein
VTAVTIAQLGKFCFHKAIPGIKLSHHIHTTELFVPDSSPFEVEIAIARLTKYSYKAPGSNQILAELIQAGSDYCLRSINSLIVFRIRKTCLISGRSLLVYHFTRRALKLAVVIIVDITVLNYHTQFYPMFFSQC